MMVYWFGVNWTGRVDGRGKVEGAEGWRPGSRGGLTAEAGVAHTPRGALEAPLKGVWTTCARWLPMVQAAFVAGGEGEVAQAC